MKIIGPYPTNAVGLLLGVLALAGCGRPDPPTGPAVARQLKGSTLPSTGKVSTGYCRHDYSGGFTCVLRGPRGRATCSVAVDDSGKVKDDVVCAYQRP